MTIVPSRSEDIQRWVAALSGGKTRNRDSAVARLTLVGERALPALLKTLASGSPVARVGALRVLEGLRLARTLPEILLHVGSASGEIAAAAAAAAGAFETPASLPALAGALRHRSPAAREAAARALLQLFANGVVEAMEPLLAAAFDPRLEDPVQAIAFQVVDLLPEAERLAILKQSRERAGRTTRHATDDVEALLTSLPDGPAAVTALYRALVALSGASSGAAAEARARVHLALAERDSRIALYDLRERLSERPVRAGAPLLRAAGRLGEASLVPTIVALAADEPSRTEACVAALGAIMARARLRRTHRAVRAVRPEHRGVLNGLWSRASRARLPKA
jgi:HEAT repeats